MIKPNPEFGSAIATTLKEAITQTEGVTLVRTSPARGAITDIKLMVNPDRRIGEALVPGEVLFVGFDQPTYDFGEMNRVIAEIAGKVTHGEATISKAGPYVKDISQIGSIRFTEVAPQGITVRTSTVYSTEDPFLQGLFKDVQIEPEQIYTGEQSYTAVRSTHAVFYPSRLFAAVANDFEQFVGADKTTPKWQYYRPQGIFGAMTVLGAKEYLSLSSAHNEIVSLQEVLSKYHPKYRVPEELVV